MWVRGQGRSLVNFDYVTQVEARVVEASYSSSADRAPRFEIIAYRRPPAVDVVLLDMLDRQSANAVIDRLEDAIMAGTPVVDLMDLLDGLRREGDGGRPTVNPSAEADFVRPT